MLGEPRMFLDCIKEIWKKFKNAVFIFLALKDNQQRSNKTQLYIHEERNNYFSL